MERWFYRPDTEALEVVLAVAAAHYSSQAEPVWLFVQGPSGSGKTAICIQAITGAPRAHIAGAMTPQTLVSFYGGKVGGLLKEPIGTNGIILFKDFTTVLTMREDARTEIVGQLREVYDGKWSRATGVAGFMWEGKVTCIAACTSALEKAWSLYRDMGERFLTVRWPRIGGVDLALVAGKQQGHEKEIADGIAKFGREILLGLPQLPPISPEHNAQIAAMAELVATLRPHVHRNNAGEVIEVPGAEEPGRIHKGLSLIVRGHAAAWRRSAVLDDDVRLARRVACDSIPLRLYSVLRGMSMERSMLVGDIIKHRTTGKVLQPQSTARWNLVALEALRAVERVAIPGEFDVNTCEWKLSEKFLRLNEEAGFSGVLR